MVTLAGSLRNPNWASAETPTATIINPVSNSGVENLSIDATSVTTSLGVINFYWTYNCWVHGVRYVNIPYAGTWSMLGVHDTFEQNYFFGSTLSPGADNYAINMTSGSDNLVQNNIIQKEEGSFLIEGSDTGSVYGYNFSIWNNNGNNTGLNPAFFFHAGDRYELVEGNIANSYYAENYHGPKLASTLFSQFVYRMGIRRELDAYASCKGWREWRRYNSSKVCSSQSLPKRHCERPGNSGICLYQLLHNFARFCFWLHL